jgi:anti-anti-sigma factor
MPEPAVPRPGSGPRHPAAPIRCWPGRPASPRIGRAVTHPAAGDASLRLTSRPERGGYVIAALGGGLGIVSAPALREQLLSLLRAASQLIIDLSAVEHADASGLAVLVGSGRRARLLGGSLRLAAPSPELVRVLSATGLNQHLDIFPTVRAAITGQPGLPEATFPPGTAPARGHRIDGAVAGAAPQPAKPAGDRATAGAGQGLGGQRPRRDDERATGQAAARWPAAATA